MIKEYSGIYVFLILAKKIFTSDIFRKRNNKKKLNSTWNAKQSDFLEGTQI